MAVSAQYPAAVAWRQPRCPPRDRRL